MADIAVPLPARREASSTEKRLPLTLSALRRRLNWLRWLVPGLLALGVVVYELGPAPWLYARLGVQRHFLAEGILFGTIGPALTYLFLDFLGRWLEERETSDLQAQVLAEARQAERASRELTDVAIQNLFAASALITSLKTTSRELSPELASQLDTTEQALDRAVQQLRARLLS